MNWNKVKGALIPVGIGFVIVALALGFLKNRFGIEIGDPPDFEEQPEADGTDTQASS